jgi:hypothetical protein
MLVTLEKRLLYRTVFLNKGSSRHLELVWDGLQSTGAFNAEIRLVLMLPGSEFRYRR